MAIQVTTSGDITITDGDLWMQRALKAEKQCEEIHERLDYWKNRALDAESRANENAEKLANAHKDLRNVQKQFQQVLDDLQAKNMELLAQKASAYDLITGGNPVSSDASKPARRPAP